MYLQSAREDSMRLYTAARRRTLADRCSNGCEVLPEADNRRSMPETHMKCIDDNGEDSWKTIIKMSRGRHLDMQNCTSR